MGIREFRGKFGIFFREKLEKMWDFPPNLSKWLKISP